LSDEDKEVLKSIERMITFKKSHDIETARERDAEKQAEEE
jgi:hypothetical protein